MRASQHWGHFVENVEGSVVGEDVKLGHRIVIEACKEPLRRIAENSGVSGDYYVTRLLEMASDTAGFDAVSREIVNLKQKGILDPAKVVASSLRYATSAAAMIATLGCSIADHVEAE